MEIPVAQPDFSKLFSGDFTAAFPFSSLCPFDVKSLLEMQRKNLQAFTEAQRLVCESFQAIGQRQAAIFSQLIADNSSLLKEIVNEGTPEQKVAKQADLIKKTYEASVANWRELSDIAGKSGQEATDIVNKRVTASLTELKSSLAKKGDVSNSNNASQKKAA
jgi:phasin family protein